MKKYVIVTGGQLFNKGAQAMTFIVVNEIAKRYPQYKVVVVSANDSKRSDEEKDNYKFDIIAPAKVSVMENILFSQTLSRNIYLKITRNPDLNSYCDYLENAAALIDISGYALGSNWGNSSAISYFNIIALAKSKNVPVYIMPQSFGPFDFTGIRGKYTMAMLKSILSYPRVIMAREEEGKNALIENFKLKNVIKTPDMVLIGEDIDLNNIYKKVPEKTSLEISSSSVAIIPNSQNDKYGDKEELLRVYHEIIDLLLNMGKQVYLVFHSSEDKKLCVMLKAQYPSEPNVVFIDKELTCYEFEKAVRKFDFVIASRFHSIVLAYKNATPAIIMGWATKYKELAVSVKQEQYQFDVRNGIGLDTITATIKRMNDNFKAESNVIRSQLDVFQKQNLFDYIVL
jgi:colanic acid/amylovoran biosynthesis protein